MVENNNLELNYIMLKGNGLYVVHISLCNVPSFIVIGVTFVKSSHWMQCKLSIVYRFHSNYGFISFCVNVSS
jgi:hypothetical protein